MKLVVTGLIMVIFMAALSAEDAPHYIGSDKCARMCHKGEKKGSQYELWQSRKHSTAFKTLGTPEAKETAEKNGVKGDPQKASECLRCHVTAFGVKKELVEPTCTNEEGVGCEACHGPGSNYRKLSVMKNREKAVAAGLIVQNEALCVKCHNEESPTYKPFNYEEDVKKISHPDPRKAKKK